MKTLKDFQKEFDAQTLEKIQRREYTEPPIWGLIWNLKHGVEGIADAQAILAILKGKRSGDIYDFRIEHNKTFCDFSGVVGLEKYVETVMNNIAYDLYDSSLSLYQRKEAVAFLKGKLMEATSRITPEEVELAKRIYQFHCAQDCKPLKGDEGVPYMNHQREMAEKAMELKLADWVWYLGERETVTRCLDFLSLLARDQANPESESYKTFEDLLKDLSYVNPEYRELHKQETRSHRYRFIGTMWDIYQSTVDWAKDLTQRVIPKESFIGRVPSIMKEIDEATKKMKSDYSI